MFGLRGISLAIVSASLSIFASPALAQVSDDIVEATTGTWLIASADGSLGCRVQLSKDKTIGGYALTEESPCGPPYHDMLAAWDFAEPGIVFRDATRKSVLGFEEQEGGPWRTPLEVEPAVYLVPEPGTMERVPTKKAVSGTWALLDRKGKTLCHVTLLDTPAAGYDDANALELSKDCNATVRKTKITFWQISEIYLSFSAGEESSYGWMPAADGFVTDDGKYRLQREKR
jgi:hypothetical protein